MSLKHSFTKSIFFYHSQKNKIKKKLNKKKRFELLYKNRKSLNLHHPYYNKSFKKIKEQSETLSTLAKINVIQ